MKTVNAFSEGINMNVADSIRKNTVSRRNLNVRIIDLDGSSFLVTNVRGTEERFQITSGYTPIASKAFNNILYIVSVSPGGITEIGSFPSPDYNTDGYGEDYYRPFNNLDDGPLRSTLFEYTEDSDVSIDIQPDYDDSVNVVLTCRDTTPRIINSRFKKESDGSLAVITDRSGDVNSNSYTATSFDSETTLILRSEKILGIDYSSISSGGKLLPGNYVYIFSYLTEDFNETEVVGQSSICQVFRGTGTVSGGIQSEETDKKVVLDLTNLDTNFKYIKVYFKYSSGTDSLFQAVYELTTPIDITESAGSLSFTHTGYEDSEEISEDTLNIDYSIIDSAGCSAVQKGHLFLAGIKERSYDFSVFQDAAQTITPTQSVKTGTNYYYNDPENVYKYLGYFGAETYPFAVVFILSDGSLTPPFPIRGKDFYLETAALGDGSDYVKDNGLIRFESIDQQNFGDSLYNKYIRHLTLDLTTIKSQVEGTPEYILDDSIGFFIVRGERVSDQIAQGYLFPTVKVGPVDMFRVNPSAPNYYSAFTDENDYKVVPAPDQMMEAFRVYVLFLDESDFVIEETGQIDNGYMPCRINSFWIDSPTDTVINIDQKYWAFYSGDSISVEAAYVNPLTRDDVYLHKLGFGKHAASDILDNKWKATGPAGIPAFDVDTSLLYEFLYPSLSDVSNHLANIRYVPEGSFSGSGKFISAVGQRMQFYAPHENFDFRQNYESYFGVEITGAAFTDVTGPTKPIGGGLRWEEVGSDETSGPSYANPTYGALDISVLINIYPQSGPISDSGILYPNADAIIYKQVSPRYSWDTVPDTIDVFGGDCYIGRVTRKISKSPYKNKYDVADLIPGGSGSWRDNIDAGIMIEIEHECKYNPALRVEYQHDESETEKRTFFPKRNIDYNDYRQYRLPETLKTNRGYGVTMRPKSFYPVSSLAPSIKTEFYSRIFNSSKHIPNGFRNGYRTFIGSNFKDYDASMGRIIRLLPHRGDLLVVFEHGIGIAPISQRIQTGSDTAGAIFVESQSVLPPYLGYYSREIGSQDPRSVIVTPYASYGVDVEKKKIWKVTDKMELISEHTVSFFLNEEGIISPRSGYDLKFNEVLFTTDEWTLCYNESAGFFTSFYSFVPVHYALRGESLYSFNNGFHEHNMNTYRIYDTVEDCFVEFVVNDSPGVTKVIDYLELTSNNIRPSKIELYTFTGKTYNKETIDTNLVELYSIINDETNIFTEENNIKYRDKRFIAQVPVASVSNGEWEVETRIRHPHVIVRVTYNTEDKLELLNVVTTYRPSFS